MILTGILSLILAVSAVPTLFLVVEVVAAILANHRVIRGKIKICDLDYRLAVLVPAHNEEAGIDKTLNTIKGQMAEGDRLVVVADNCTDQTALIAQSLGAEVVVRNEQEKRGKGYALDCGRRYLSHNEPDVVVIVDADVIVGPGTLTEIAARAFMSKRPVQAKNLVVASTSVNHNGLISMFAFFFKNYIRPLGLQYLGGGCLLTGTGMALPWGLYERADLATGNIVEDMQLGIDLAIQGHIPLYCPTALVTSEMAPIHAARTQKTRWEHGHINTLRTQVVRLVKEAVSQKRPDLLLLGLELSVPPLASLVLCYGALFFIIGTLWGIHVSSLGMVMVTGLMICALGGAVLGGWFYMGRDLISGRQLLLFPLYLLWKIPVYVALLAKPQKSWLRTKRK